MVFARLFRSDRNRGPNTPPFDPDDKWSNLYREREKNNLYKWVGVRSGGELIQVYEKDGEEGVLNFAQEKLEPMMYNEGNFPQLIKYADYVRWKKAVNVVFGVTEDESKLSEANSKFREHEAQWRLNKRGVEGETLIHLLLNREEPLCSEIARILIHKYPGLSKDIYLGEEMFGQSSLHLAIVHDDYETVQLLLEKGASVNSRASGDFFLPENWDSYDYKTMDYQGYAYYGEYPLAFAACFENKDIYDLLLQYGANPDLQDQFGNTSLHMCVINYSNSMYSYAVRHWHKPAHTNITNAAGMTPLTLATKLGRKQIFEEMLELSKVEFWRFSDMTCSAYPIETLDTIRPDGSTNYESALMTVINGSTPEHLEMIGSEVIQRLLADKWKAFAMRKLFERLGLLIAHLICLCFVVYLRPTQREKLYMQDPDWEDILRGVFEFLTLVGCFWFVFFQQAGELRTQGLSGYFKNMQTAPSKLIYLVANICLISTIPFRFAHNYQVEEALMVLAIPGSWIFLLFFARSAKLTGPFVQMIYSMIAGDMMRFGIISSIFLLSFSQVFYFVGKDIMIKQELPEDNEDRCEIDGYKVTTFSTFSETFISLFRASMGGYEYEELSCTNYEALTKTLFILYMFIMPIMMINILIAMMGNTYTTIITKAEKAWRQQYAQIVMVLERSVDRERLKLCQLEYSIKLNEPGRDARGLMVIKQTTKTKAFQRKQAIFNWKSIGRKVITMSKELGLESTKFLLHSHDQIITDDAVININNVPTQTVLASRSPISRTSMQTEAVNFEANNENRNRDDEQQEPAEHNEAHFGRRKSIMPHSHAVDMMLVDSIALRAVVTHARRQQLQLNNNPFLANRRMLANGNLLPGLVDAAYHQNHPAAPSISRRAPTAERESVQVTNELDPEANIPDANMLHITQRQLLPTNSLVRGIEMLPSYEIPNIPSNQDLLRPSTLNFELRESSTSVNSPRIKPNLLDHKSVTVPNLSLDETGQKRTIESSPKIHANLFKKKRSILTG